MYVCIVLCVSVNSYSSLCVRVRITAFQIHLVRFGPLLETQIQRVGSERAGRSPDPRQVVVGDRHGGLLQHLGYPPMQSNSEERHLSDCNGDSPGDDQIPQCECLFLLLSSIK